MIDLKRFRKENNIKQKEICELLDIAQPYLSAIERGERPLNKERFELLYKQYGDILLKYKRTSNDIVINLKSEEEDTGDILIPKTVWKVIQQQADSLSARDRQIDDLIKIIKRTNHDS